jgi:hypothetical protein
MTTELTTTTTELTVEEKITDLIERQPEVFLPDLEPRPVKRQEPSYSPVSEADRARIIDHHKIAMQQFATACDAEAADLRKDVAALQREWAALPTLLSVDPVAGAQRKSDLLLYQSELMSRDARLARTREHLSQVLYSMSEQAIWGEDMDARNRELPELVKWGKAQGMSGDDILLAGQSPAVAWSLYKAWKSGEKVTLPRAQPRATKPIQAVPRPGGKPPVTRPSRNKGQARDLELGGEILRKAGVVG